MSFYWYQGRNKDFNLILMWSLMLNFVLRLRNQACMKKSPCKKCSYYTISWNSQLQSVVQLINETSQSFREGKKWKCNSRCGTRSPHNSSAKPTFRDRLASTRQQSQNQCKCKQIDSKCDNRYNQAEICYTIWKNEHLMNRNFTHFVCLPVFLKVHS